MKRVLWIGDGSTPTGFSTVNHNIIDNLPADKYDIHHLAINYNGDPHEYKHKMYPAATPGGDVWGMSRLPAFAKLNPDFIFILNDVYIIDRYLDVIKKNFKTIPPIVAYFPIDSTEISPRYYQHFDILTRAVAYTRFGFDEVAKTLPNYPTIIMPHGVDTDTFKKLPITKAQARTEIFGDKGGVLIEEDTFIALNANRNQPRKRIDITIEGFALFAENKPENVKLYLHMGLKDAGWEILELCKRYGIDGRLIITNMNMHTQIVPREALNLIYNSANVGINTSTGEGWGLVNVEHAVTGAPQIVPNHSACTELFGDVGALMPIITTSIYEQTLTRHSIVSPESLAQGLDILYNDRELLNKLSIAGIEKFTAPRYSWKTIGANWDKIFESLWQQ